jgi:hypothetical protein
VSPAEPVSLTQLRRSGYLDGVAGIVAELDATTATLRLLDPPLS